ncbi:PTS mannitol transporter subunit IIA [Alkalihalobacillus alcalophilus ATCC 27647 = CGMCC 1.3604]|uniref:Mannitol-specific phosphotransferase enzyme IIA component n=1 Tax=Alkalihalobacillus alcalophilus ATCC 27647 = CGMCC 1.3604 TaxID=1218173 RepID=J8TSB2_ALKAL|nr:PTS sugar transporter subunit IIA [Alkalihalobacillus alcalophilus]AFV25755.1 mannitol/fructose transporter [Alkalihalobacillus alcalophilus ATCC 27647 = CGMCC 1.3604]KGA97545.1 PTS mannitol transporter subunit IIA [Alkalihalobacillus alcalophilus ATCC 27647 = CGMCC 1.3604]MED1560801.1 PTS sugar transporter subunit IIA [Alkalihalobacillus alcalophilus]THG90934.1 PTS mannitol transporter subunit IIA [Alkalihalobacillus alcalophilus ATCC 27647 = CGMCC 1.3604]
MKQILAKENIQFNGQAKTKEEAIKEVGAILTEKGYVNPTYVDKMLEREELTSTFMGNMLAIPHGTDDAKKEVIASGLAVQIYKEPINWNGEKVRLVIGIAGVGDEHLEILSQIAIVCSEEENVKKIVEAREPSEVLALFEEVN